MVRVYAERMLREVQKNGGVYRKRKAFGRCYLGTTMAISVSTAFTPVLSLVHPFALVAMRARTMNWITQ
jgi:hypothetical protein